MKVVKRCSLHVFAGLALTAFLVGHPLLAQEAAEPVVDEVAAPVDVLEPAVAEAAPVAPAAEIEVAPAAEAAPDENGETLPVGTKSETGLITVSLDDVELDDVVRLFTRLSGANIICATTNLRGSVTANLQDVEWEPAFRAILERQNLMLLEDVRNKGIYYVEPKQPDAPEPWITETFKLSYLKSSEAANMLTSLLGIADTTEKVATPRAAAPRKSADGEPVKEAVAVAFRKEGRVVSYPAGNMVVVSTTAAKMEEVRQVLLEVDLPRQQVYIEAKIIELTGDVGKKIGIDWSMLDGYQVAAGPFGRSYRQTVTRESGSADYAVAERAAVYDETGQRLSRDSGAGANSGVADALTPVAVARTSASTYSGVGNVTPGATALAGVNEMAGRFNSISDVRTAIFSADAVSLVLSALQASEDAAVVSNPKIIVANEERAMIDMATKEPYVTVEREIAGTGDNTTYTYSTAMAVIPGNAEENKLLPYIEQAFFTYGIKLDVTPRINNASNITVTIEPTLSSLIDYYTPAGEGSTRYPRIQSKHVKTVFSLSDGQTAVIGGLTTTSDTEYVKKIPILGDIPLIGKYLFSHTAKRKTQRETIIFVTVGIINADDPRSSLSVPEASKLIRGRVDASGRLIGAMVPDVVEDAAE